MILEAQYDAELKLFLQYQYYHKNSRKSDNETLITYHIIIKMNVRNNQIKRKAFKKKAQNLLQKSLPIQQFRNAGYQGISEEHKKLYPLSRTDKMKFATVIPHHEKSKFAMLINGYKRIAIFC
eukprot:TRINITY_DN1669_c0_g1_i3.p6 TRINITY_DN1669_c0_g1~~TRINITY_DN1669_c0_g1_i3.p6  ORF type:complete len:123 (+),score=1.23 TRINITY_DN1669_c0_g1_i3:709-1077(+)